MGFGFVLDILSLQLVAITLALPSVLQLWVGTCLSILDSVYIDYLKQETEMFSMPTILMIQNGYFRVIIYVRIAYIYRRNQCYA